MRTIRFLGIHRTWEDWLGMVIGVVIGLSPWLAGQQDSQAVMWNAIIVGALVLTLAGFGLVALQRWEEAGQAACGAWLFVSPFLLGYATAGPLRFWHFALGAIVVALAALALWQDWNLRDEELAQHGQ